MTFFLGNYGAVAFRRGTGTTSPTFNSTVIEDDVETTLMRLGFDKSLDNIITGDRVEFSTTDSRKLCFLPASAWGGTRGESFTAFVNVNEVGGLRLYSSFSEAINNNRSYEIDLVRDFGSGGPLSITVSIQNTVANTLGNVLSYEFNASREAIDITSLSDYFRNQYNAGLLSGSGRMECAFDYATVGSVDPPLAVMQTIQRLDVGCAFEALLYLTNQDITPDTKTVFYQITAVATQVGVSVTSDSIVNTTIDFVTSGPLRLRFGAPASFILKEDTDKIQLEEGTAETPLDALLKETDD